jgi:hypothetical protein
VSSADGGLHGKANGIDKRRDAFSIALERSFQTPGANVHQRELGEQCQR